MTSRRYSVILGACLGGVNSHVRDGFLAIAYKPAAACTMHVPVLGMQKVKFGGWLSMDPQIGQTR